MKLFKFLEDAPTVPVVEPNFWERYVEWAGGNFNAVILTVLVAVVVFVLIASAIRRFKY